MDITETRIDLVEFACPDCTCGSCIADSLQEIGSIAGVVHVRVDRRRTQIVVRHAADATSVGVLEGVVAAKGIPLRS